MSNYLTSILQLTVECMRSKSPGAVGVFRDEPLMAPKGD